MLDWCRGLIMTVRISANIGEAGVVCWETSGHHYTWVEKWYKRPQVIAPCSYIGALMDSKHSFAELTTSHHYSGSQHWSMLRLWAASQLLVTVSQSAGYSCRGLKAKGWTAECDQMPVGGCRFLGHVFCLVVGWSKLCVLVRIRGFRLASTFIWWRGLIVDFFETDSSSLASQVLKRQVCMSSIPAFFLDVEKLLCIGIEVFIHFCL